jgi:hypothetical protein
MSGKDEKPPKRVIVQVKRSRRLGIDLTLTPQNWLPDARNGRLVFTARIYDFENGKWEYPGEARQITFSFKEVSKENGICMNYPTKDTSNTNPDLFFPDDDSMKEFDLDEDETDGDAEKKCPTEILKAKDNPAHKHHYLKATTKKPVTEATVTVRCEDYGAFGILKVEAEDCETLKSRERVAGCQGLGEKEEDKEVRIPRDDNGNNIADSAAQDTNKDGTKALPDKDEDDTPIGNGDKGDGLTNYEEYRGFIVKGGESFFTSRARKKHIRTDINNKDVFIYDQKGLTTGYFNASELVYHLLPGPDYYNGNSKEKNVPGGLRGDHVPDPIDSQCINCNRTSHSGGDQHCIRIIKKHIGGNTVGYCYGAPDVPLLPKDMHYVAVDVTAIGTATELKMTIAHELGHAVHVVHHGDLKPKDYCADCKYTRAGGYTSGNVSCIMRYGPSYDSEWCHKDGVDCCRHPIPNNEAIGNTFCDSADATGCNIIGAPHNFTNDATVGNCMGQIRVKDWEE